MSDLELEDRPAPSRAPTGPPRCPTHGLALGPNGLCVMCQREGHDAGRTRERASSTASSGSGVWVLVIALVVAVGGGVLAYRYLRSPSLAEASERVSVRMFSAHGCQGCATARAWFESERVRFSEIDVTGNPAAARQMRRLDPMGRTPTIEVDGRHVPEPNPETLTAAILGAAERSPTQ